jgi:hypothetical protein
MHEFEKTVDGILKYINNELLDGMNETQKFIARVFISRMINNEEKIKTLFINNGFIRTFGVITSDGMVDVEGLAKDIKREIERAGKITFDIPMFGKYTFTPSDVDVLYNTITGGTKTDESY